MHKASQSIRAAIIATALNSLIISCTRETPSGSGLRLEHPSANASRRQGLGPNDVSILITPKTLEKNWRWPLGSYGSFDTPLSSSDVGAYGELLPQYVIDAVKAQMVKDFDQDGEKVSAIRHNFDHGRLMPVALRFDPCFPQMREDDDAACTRQLRIVWQPGGEGDAAIHALHDLSREEFAAAMTELARLKEMAGFDYDSEPLGPHPVMKKEGLDGPYAQGIFHLIKRLAGAKNLSMVAAMSGSGFDVWRFVAFDHRDGVLQARTMPHGSLPIQQFQGFYRSILYTHFEGSVLDKRPQMPDLPFFEGHPETGVGKNPGTIKSQAKASMAEVSREQQEAAFHFLRQVEDPDRTTVLTHDCADCHLASQQRQAMEEEIPGLASGVTPNPYRMPLFTGSLHNFGYYRSFAGSGPSVSQRTINETKQVVSWVNRKIFGQP